MSEGEIVDAGSAEVAERAVDSAPPDTGRILLIDDEPIIQEVLSAILAPEGHRLTVVPDAERGLAALEEEDYDLVVLDLMLPGMGGLEALTRIRQRDPDQVILMLTAFGSVETAVQAMRMGAHDYLAKPFQNEEVLRSVRHGLRHRRLALENRTLRRALQGKTGSWGLVGKSRTMQALYALIEQAAPSGCRVLI